MGLIYRPVKQYMIPNNTSIDPSVINNFTCIIDGFTCIAYRFQVYDYSNNLISPPSGSRINLGSTLYGGNTLTVPVSANQLTAGNEYKWQITLYANDILVSSINTTTNILTANNHNLNTGDTIYIQATTTIPAGLSAFTTYYVRKLTANTLTLHSNYESAVSGGTTIDITSVGAGTITISNIATSEQVAFKAYSNPTLSLTGGAINNQSYIFAPTYSQAQGVLVNKFIAYLYNESGLELQNSGEIYSSNVRYTFDGLISGNTYKVKFDITTAIGQTATTGLITYTVSYSSPSTIINVSSTNNVSQSSITTSWDNVVQLTAIVTGTSSYVDNYVITGNKALHLDIDSEYKVEDLNITEDNTFIHWWTPDSTSFVGVIFELSDTVSGDYLRVGYDGYTFYRNKNGVILYNTIQDLMAGTNYMLILRPDDLIVKIL